MNVSIIKDQHQHLLFKMAAVSDENLKEESFLSFQRENLMKYPGSNDKVVYSKGAVTSNGSTWASIFFKGSKQRGREKRESEKDGG